MQMDFFSLSLTTLQARTRAVISIYLQSKLQSVLASGAGALGLMSLVLVAVFWYCDLQSHCHMNCMTAAPKYTSACHGDWCCYLQHAADPGYWSTSRLILEAALCLALQEDQLAQAGLLQGGCITPASACGLFLVDRLRKADLTVEIEGMSSNNKKGS